MNWRDILQERLLLLQPTSVLALDATARDLAGSVLPQTPIVFQGMLPQAPCALALGIDALNGLNARQALHRISQARLYAAPRILLAVPSDCVLDEPMFLSLGFMQTAVDPGGDRRIHYYDLETYKTVPDWLNARHWAHPERWEP
ncbi:MAG: hypothetical protein GC183_12860 [Thiobacillus sp.]|nr:hypothetical protein [Thiobacillus sp.]